MLHQLATLLIQTAASNPSPFEWASTHLHLVGWPTLCYVAWKVGTTFTELKNGILKTVTQIDHMATNHFPHMQESLAKQDGILEGVGTGITSMDASLKTLVEVMKK